ncbi:hypothetical protein LOAG_14877 [Loa loa]|uniref:Uncharacterized protein n=1 Tax=Loa loa TaxID=7209 RepID=A0A1S0THF8_LOALO|nr:hypothetical protein LOAG_14877 [Loa loa]EFO13651.2 hypothetical protein LOAG_14877 [Loa loa]
MLESSISESDSINGKCILVTDTETDTDENFVTPLSRSLASLMPHNTQNICDHDRYFSRYK